MDITSIREPPWETFVNASSGEHHPNQRIVFVCLHGSAKSLIAAEHFNRLARERGSELRAGSVGLEPDAEVPAPVAAGLLRDGIDVRGYLPQPATRERLAGAARIVSFGCDFEPFGSSTPVERWDDMPMVSDGFDRARDAIVARVEKVLDSLA